MRDATTIAEIRALAQSALDDPPWLMADYCLRMSSTLKLIAGDDAWTRARLTAAVVDAAVAYIEADAAYLAAGSPETEVGSGGPLHRLHLARRALEVAVGAWAAGRQP